MSLCGSQNCNCGFVGSGNITVTGTGQPGDPYTISGSPTPDPIVRTYTSNDSWTKPAGLKYIIVEVQGGGGGSGGVGTTAAGQAAVASGGGGGGYARKLILASALSASETVTVGTGGAGGAAGLNNGSVGNPSSFGAFCTGGGGGNGSAGTTVATPHGGNSQAAGGSGTGGDVNVSGGSAITGVGVNTSAKASSGGESYFAGRVPGQTVSTGSDGAAGELYGGGARGAINAQSQGTARAGAAGANGIVIVTEYYE